MMKFIVKPHPEIFIKSDSVKKRFTKILECNLRNIIQARTESVAVFNRREYIEISAETDAYRDEVLTILTHTSGIHHSLEVQQSSFTDLHDIYEQVLTLNRQRIENKTFVVRAKRRGNHNFTSVELERYVGGGLNQAVESARVSLKDPQETILLEVAYDKLHLVLNKFKGLGGFPLGTQEDVLSLLSGGYDSGVSSYLHIKRGSKVHYCFFNLGGPAHEIGVKQVAHFLWHKYGSSAKVRFISVDFEPVVAEILEKVDSGQMGVVLKRMFMRAAGMLAEKFGIQALVTGEAIGQVSSQTLTNLRLIDKVTDTLILRPLINWDKEEIINVARAIGTEDFARTMPEYCGVISKKPTVKAQEHKLAIEEAKFDFSVLDKVVYDARIMDIRDIATETAEIVPEAEQVSELPADCVVLDIRRGEEIDAKPLTLPNVDVKQMIYYKLASNFSSLDQSKEYYLYCDHGVMSKLQALYLIDLGFSNVKVYRP